MAFKTTALTEDFGTVVESSTHDDILSLEPAQIISLFKNSSLLLFRGFDVDTEKFKEFTNSLSQDFLAYIGGAYSRETIEGDKTLLSVTGHKQHFAVPFHGEMYYKKHRPKMMWFYCATPAVKDGETTVCDGIQVYEELTPHTQELFQHHKIKYIRTYLDSAWQQIYQTDNLSEVNQVCQENNLKLTVNEDQSITTEYICPAVIDSRCGKRKVFINNILPVVEQEAQAKQTSLVRLEDGTKIPDEVIDEIKAVTDRLTVLIPWQTGDIVMLDNKRLLHGRRAFADNQRDIYVRLGNPAFVF